MGWRALLAMTLLAGLADARAQNYPTPGFDCANASSPLELRICRSPRLSELDGRHWYLADRAIRAAPDRERARAEVEGWINSVRNECQADKCLEDAYTARNAMLEGSVAQLPPEKPPPQPRMLPTTPAAPPAPSAPPTSSALPAVVTPAPDKGAPIAPPAAAATQPSEEGGGMFWLGLFLGLLFVGYVLWRNARKK